MADPPRLAILVVAHANPATFKRLVAALRHEAIRVFVHLDARSDETRFRAPGQDHVTFLADRQENHWGAFTQVEVALSLFEAARRAGPFRSHVLISGDSLPLVTNDTLVAAFSARPTVVPMTPVEPDAPVHQRLSRIYLPHARIGRMRAGAPAERYLTEADFADMARAMRTAPLKAALPFRPFKGSQWIALSAAHLDQLTGYFAAHPDYVELFRYSLIADEMFFHSAMPIVDPTYRPLTKLMAADWSRTPAPFRLTDPDEIDRVFADRRPFFRKFGDRGLALVDAVLERRLDRAAVLAQGGGMTWSMLGGRAAAKTPAP